MKVGFTGPRLGMTDLQYAKLTHELHRLGATQLHHGDCRGSDEQADQIAADLGIYRVAHPPTSTGLRAFCASEEIREPAPFIVRDHTIVLETEILIGTPDRPEYRRSGTWTTLRYARRIQRPIIAITPAGIALEGDAIWAGRPTGVS